MTTIRTQTKRNYGVDHEYIVEPRELRELWTEVTGRKTVTYWDLDAIERLAQMFGTEVTIDRIPPLNF